MAALTTDDIELLMEALRNLEQCTVCKTFNHELILNPSEGNEETIFRNALEKAAESKRDIEERVTLVKAKLIKMQDKATLRDLKKLLTHGDNPETTV